MGDVLDVEHFYGLCQIGSTVLFVGKPRNYPKMTIKMVPRPACEKCGAPLEKEKPNRIEIFAIWYPVKGCHYYYHCYCWIPNKDPFGL
jgi:hypothetical protein